MFNLCQLLVSNIVIPILDKIVNFKVLRYMYNIKVVQKLNELQITLKHFWCLQIHQLKQDRVYRVVLKDTIHN